MLVKPDFYIGGAWTPARDGTPYTVIGPATEEPVAQITLGGQADTDAAVAAAKAALPIWAASTRAERVLSLIHI